MSEQILKHKNFQNQSQKQISRDKHTVHWFRKGLRLHDNPALRAGIKGATTFRCIFIIDPWFAGSSNVGINKWRFLLQCLEDLDHGLRKLNSRLFVIRGQPAEALPKLFKEWNITCLTFEEDPEPFGKVRDQNVSQMCKELGIEVISAVSHTLYNLDTIIEKNNGQAPLTYHKFQAVIASTNPPVQSESALTQEILNNTCTPIMDDHDDKYNVPTLDELGFDTEGLKPPVWIGGETEALARLERHLERKAWVASFGRPKMTPQSLLATQTGLSPYLRFGCLSTRLFYHQLTDLYKKIKKAMPPLSLHGQLLWREFFYCAATKNPNFDKMEGNQICVQIPWDKNAEALAKWSNGQTGFPWIDAIMTQLREEGWIHHLARHAVACFLTRGDLWISWEEGMKVFEELLLDADWSNNAGMWMWLSCSSFFQQFFHCYCPVRFGRKADPNGDYIRRFLPILKNFPAKYIHEPWNAPESVQRAAKCVVGKDYPVPMVNHAVVSRTNMERMKQVYLHLTKYRVPAEEKENSHKILSPIAVLSNSQTYLPYAVSSPSPTTVIVNTNNSGNYLCQQYGRNRPTSTIISSDINNQQQNSDQYHQIHQQQEQQHQQLYLHHQNQYQHNDHHHHLYQPNQSYQSSEQHQQKQPYNNKNVSTITVHDYVKLQQRQAINDSDCLSINIYDNIRQLQQNYQGDFDEKTHQQNQHNQQDNYEDQLNLGDLSVNIENIKYSRYNQQYNRIKINDKDYHNNHYKPIDTISSTNDLNNYQKNHYINNSIIMEYGYNDYSHYVDSHLLTDQYKNDYNDGNVGYNDDAGGTGGGGGVGDIVEGVEEGDKSVLQHDTNYINNNNDSDQQHQQQYQKLQRSQQQQIDNNDEQDNLKLNFKCELEEHDK